MTGTPDEQDRVVIRDNRKIDPVTGEARKASPATGPAEPGGQPGGQPAGESSAPTTESTVPESGDAKLLEERTQLLQRVQAEYANYRKRAERDRLAAGEIAIGRVLAELLPILDDLERAKAHGDLTGALKAVADKLEQVTTKLGLQVFGEVGDPFDPAIHEAVMHDESDSVTVPTATTVLRPGYKHGERLLRAAMVGVTDPITYTVPTSGAGDQPSAHAGEPEAGQDETGQDEAGRDEQGQEQDR